MNKLLKLMVVGLLVFSTAVYGQETENRNVGSFNEVRVSQAITVYLKQGTKESVKVEASGIDLDEVLTEVSGSRLKIHLEHGNYRNINVKVYVTCVKLKGISASSASGIFSEGKLTGDNLQISVSSAADVEIDVDYSEIEVSASSSGDVEISGRTKRLDADTSSAGGIDAYDLNAEMVRVRASSAGSAKVSVSQEIDARASSGGSIRYRGNPSKSQTDSSSGGSVRKS